MNDYRTYSGKSQSIKSDLSSESAARVLPLATNLLLTATAICSSVLFPLFIKQSESAFIFAWLSCVLCAAVIFISAKKTAYSVIATIALIVFIALSGSPIIPAFVFGTVISIGGASALLCAAKKLDLFYYIVLFPIAYLISAAITRDLTISLFSLVLLLPSLSMALSSKKGGRTLSVVLCAISEALIICGAILFWIYLTYGSVSFSTLDRAAADTLHYINQSVKLAYSSISGEAVSGAMLRELDAISRSAINTLIGTVGALCAVISFISHSIHLGLMRSYGLDRYLSQKATTLTVSFEAGLVFLLAYVLSFATDSSNEVSFAATVGMNLCLILMPGLAYVGIDALAALPQKLGFLGFLLWIAIFIVILNTSANPFIIFALIGSAFAIIRHIDSWAKDFYSKGDKK